MLLCYAESPCKGCKERYAICHTVCEKWAKFEEAKQRYYEEHIKYMKKESDFYLHKMDRIDRLRKQKRKQNQH